MALPILDGNQTAATLSTVLTSGEHIPAHTVVSLGSQAITDVRSAVSGSVVSIGNFPSTQIVGGNVSLAYGEEQIGYVTIDQQGAGAVPVSGTITVGNSVTISGTVTANVFGLDQALSQDVRIPVLGFDTNISEANLGAVVPVQISNTQGAIGSGNPLPISGTVTANNPNGALTTRFGSVTTANTAQITSAVTNTSRKYLLAQNISAGTVTIGIGFSPTTTQGIQLAAGGGLTFDAFCPTGAVFWLGAVTGANYCLIEG